MLKQESRAAIVATARYEETSMDSFFGNFLYEQKVSKDNFLSKLNEVIDWNSLTGEPLSYYKGKGEIGQALCNPTIILKMLFLFCPWNVSERMTEVMADDSLAIAFFLGLDPDESVPGHSTLTL